MVIERINGNDGIGEAEAFESQLTPRERMWRDNFGGHESPSSLNLTNETKALIVSIISANTLANKITWIYDLGSAHGGFLEELAGELEGKKIVYEGIDINLKEIEDAKRHAYPNATFRVRNATNTKFPDKSADIVVMKGILGGIEASERIKIMSEAYRVLDENGTAIAADYKKNEDTEENRQKYREGEAYSGEPGTRVIIKKDKKGNVVMKDGKPLILFIAKHFIEDELLKLFEDARLVDINIQGYGVESAGPGDGLVAVRRAYNVVGRKKSSRLSAV